MTTNRLFVLPYKMGSASAKALAQALNCKRIKREGSRYRPRESDLVLNYGATTLPTGLQLNGNAILNKPEAVHVAANKLHTFTRFGMVGISTPRWTTELDVASEWKDAGMVVVARTKLTGHSGEGIVIARGDDELPTAPLYVEYVPKKEEYRVHVFNGEVIDVQRKMRKRDVPDGQVNWQVRNLSGGFVYGREGVALREEAQHLAVDAVLALGLDFGAVDIIYNERRDAYYVLEVNTAPGLTGTTLERYVDAVRRFAYES